MANGLIKFPEITVTADALGCERGGREVFRDVSFSVGAGQMLAITGPNGAGKSSLLRILAGLLRPANGRVALTPADIIHDDDQQTTHYFGHQDGFKDAMSLLENLVFWCRIYAGNADRRAIADAAGRFGLDHALELPLGVFSAGQRRRAGLARMILSPRPLWLLDEPTSALDKDGEAGLGAMMRDHLANRGLIVAATHLALPVKPDLTLNMAPA